ncbi:MAG: hypothetical protein AABY22_16035 [Nanoarchaeota archaeon]
MDDCQLEKVQIFDFVRKILALRDDFRFSITSWGRTYKRNLEVGSKFPNTSKHLKWLAVDTVLDQGEDVNDYYKKIKELSLHFFNEGDHIHIQF